MVCIVLFNIFKFANSGKNFLLTLIKVNLFINLIMKLMHPTYICNKLVFFCKLEQYK